MTNFQGWGWFVPAKGLEAFKRFERNYDEIDWSDDGKAEPVPEPEYVEILEDENGEVATRRVNNE